MLQPMNPDSRALVRCGKDSRRRARVRLSAAQRAPRLQRSSAYAPKVEKPRFVYAATEAMEGLADSEAEAAGAAGEAVELGVELGDFAWRGRWGELGGFGGRGRWEGPGERELLGGRRS